MIGDVRVIDSHVHFWNLAGDASPGIPIPWLDDHPSLRRPFLPADLGGLQDNSLHGVVFVEANVAPSHSEAELGFVDELAEEESRIVGRVAAVDLTDERSIDDTLTRLEKRRGVVGVRQNIQGRPRGFCTSPVFVRGVRKVADHDFAFDICITADQLGDATELVRQCPDTRFVLDHCGKPFIRFAEFAPWAAGIGALAAFTNVGCKISGLLTEATAEQGNVDGMRPYIEHVRQSFGPTRILYGSDWPVSTLAGGEGLWRMIVDTLAAEWSPADRQLFYAENAMRYYRVERA